MIADQTMSSDGRRNDRTGPAAKEGAGAAPTWQAFEESLATALGRMAVDTFLIISTRGEAETPYYVQFAQGGRPGFRAEAVSNTFLEGQRALSPEQEERLGTLGWQWPSPHGTEDRNFSRQWPMPAPFRVVAHLAVRTLRDVYGVTSPADLVYRRFDEEGNVFDEPALGIEREASGPDVARGPGLLTGDGRGQAMDGDLDEIAQAAVRAFLGIEHVVRDPMGDIPMSVDDVRMVVRLLGGPSPAIRVFSPVLCEVPAGPALLAAVNDANVRLRYARVLWVDDDVIVAAEVPGVHATPDLVAVLCAEVCGLAGIVREELGPRFGGDRAPRLVH